MEKNNFKTGIVLAVIPFLILIAVFVFNKNSFSNLLKSDDNKAVLSEQIGKQISENYYEYSINNLTEAIKKGKAVLFFATNWCSTCTELDQELKTDSKKLDGITVLRLDFDKATQMKSKYKVTVQHTLIQVDKDGNEITKWVGGDLEEINKNIK